MTAAFGLNTKFSPLGQKPIIGSRLNYGDSLLTGLVGFWPLLEGDGALVTDYTYNSAPGALTTAAKWTPTSFGRGLDFNTSGGYVNCGTAKPLQLTTAFSMSVWAYSTVAATNGAFPRLMSKLHSVAGGYQGYEMVQAANDAGGGLVHGAIYGQIALNGSLGGLSDTIAMPLGQWVHYVLTFNSVGGILSVYRNGKLRNSGFIGGAFGNNSLNYEIGASSEFGSTHRFQGKLDLPAVWNRVLTAAEVDRLYYKPFSYFDEVARPSRALFIINISNTYEVSDTIAGTADLSVVDGGTLYRTKSIDCTAAVTIANSAACVNSITVGAVCDLTIHIPIFLTLSIAGIAAYTMLPGQQYFTTVAVEGISDIARLSGFGYFKTLSVDGVSDIAMEQIGLKLLTLTIDGVSGVAVATLQDGNLAISVQGISACTVDPSFSYQLVLSMAGVATIYRGSALNAGGDDGLYNFLLLVANDVTTQTVQRQIPGNENPSALGSISVSCSGVFNRTVLQSLNFVQDASYKKPTEVQQQLVIISHAAVAQRIRNRTVTQTLAMTQDAEGFRATVQSIVFTHQAAARKVISRTVTQRLGMTQEATRKTVLGRSLTQMLIMGQSRLVRAPITGIIGSNTSTTPFEYYKPVVQAILIPSRCLVVLGVATKIVILPCPQFGDTQSRSSTMNLNRTMTGDTYTYVRKTDLQKLKYTFQIGTYKAAELQSFLEHHCHEIITLVNHKGETWYVNLVNNPFEFTVTERWQPKGERHDITLEFEGVQQ